MAWKRSHNKQMLITCDQMDSVRRRRKSSVSSDELLHLQSNLLGRDRNQHKIVWAKKKKSDRPFVVGTQVFCVLLALLVVYYTYYHFDHFHYHVTHYYASRWNDHHAQHALGHKLLKERVNTSAAFSWFRKSAESGHPEAAYNLAAGHLSGYETDVQKVQTGEVKKLLKFAAKNGVEEAKTLLKELCREKPNYCEH